MVAFYSTTLKSKAVLPDLNLALCIYDLESWDLDWKNIGLHAKRTLKASGKRQIICCKYAKEDTDRIPFIQPPVRGGTSVMKSSQLI
jgi:hypothetical protein